MLKKQFLCICCPTGCRLTAERENETAPWKISGNRCPRGAAYAIQELNDPRRRAEKQTTTNYKRKRIERRKLNINN